MKFGRASRLLGVGGLLGALLGLGASACSSSSHNDDDDDDVTVDASAGAHAGGSLGAAASTGGSDSGSLADGGAAGGGGLQVGSGGEGGISGDAGGGDAGPGALSYMIGIKSNGVPTGPAKVEAWLGRPLDVAGTTITTVSYVGGPYTTASGAYPLLEVSFPLLTIFKEGADLTDMAKAAAGDYDTTYTSMATTLANGKNPLLSVRIGWEFNGNWYAWSNGQGTNATYANYVSAFKHAAIAVRAKNPHVLIQWCIAWGQEDPTPYWPGAYDPQSNPGGVDVVSMDFYQANISEYNDDNKTSTWALAQSVSSSSGPIVLDWMIAFAQKEHVKVALSEYGAGGPKSGGIDTGPGLDDGTWTAASISWINSLPQGLFLWSLWSDDEPADDIATAGANPKEQAAWVSAWKGTRYAGTWWNGVAPP